MPDIKSRIYLLSLKAGFLVHYKPVILSLIIACVSFPSYGLYYSPGLDNSLPWVFNYLADGHFALGRHFLFPHGPLAFLLYPLPLHNNLAVCIALTLLCKFLLSFNFFRICRVLNKENDVTVVLISLVLQAVLDIQLVIAGLVLSHAVLFRLSGHRSELVFALLFCVFNLFIKTYGGVICILILAGEFLYLLFSRKDFKTAAFIPAVFFLIFYAFWLCLYGTFNNSFTFLVGQYELASDNSEAVSLPSNINWLPVGICLLALAAIPFVTKDTVVKHTGWLMLLPFFAAWKHAMARADVQHMPGFLNMLVFYIFFLWLIQRENKISTLVLGFVALVTFMINMRETDCDEQKGMFLLRPYNLYDLVVNYTDLAKQNTDKSQNESRIRILPDTVLRLIGTQTADVYPWNYSIIAANHLNWAPRPVIHSYVTYTGWLDEQNARHIRSESAARFLIWEITKQTYENLQSMESIDYRYLLNDGPQSTLHFFSNYELKFKNSDYMVYERRDAPVKFVPHLSEPKEPAYNEWVEVPSPEPNAVLRVKVHVKKSLPGLLKSMFYKGEEFFISCELEDGRVINHKIVPKNAADGLWLYPFILVPRNNQVEPRVKRIKLTCMEDKMVSPGYTLAFEQTVYEITGAKKTTDLQDHFFNKHEKPPHRMLLLGTTRAESISNDEGWLESLDASKTPLKDAEGKYYYTIKPGGFSGGFSFQPNRNDSLTQNPRYIQLHVTASVKGVQGTRALFVVSQTENNKLISWWYKKMTEFIKVDGSWTHIRYSEKIPVDLSRPNQPFHFYIWNADTHSDFYVDDLSVTIEAVSE